MKKYTMLSAVWLFACGAGAGQEPVDDSTLQSRLTANDDDATDPTELPSTDDPADTGVSEESDGADASDCDEPTDAVSGGTFPGDPGSAAPGAMPDLVIGAGGTAWDPPQNASVVWCNVDVPIGCPAISPAPEGGRLVVVHGMTEAGGTMGTAGGPAGNAGEAITQRTTPRSTLAAPSSSTPARTLPERRRRPRFPSSSEEAYPRFRARASPSPFPRLA